MPGDEFGDEEVGTFFGIEIEDGGDVGMIESGERESFSAKTAASRFIGQHARRQDLDGDLAFEALVVGKINNSHASGADLLTDAIMAYGFADHGKGGGQEMVFGARGDGQPACGGGVAMITPPAIARRFIYTQLSSEIRGYQRAANPKRSTSEPNPSWSQTSPWERLPGIPVPGRRAETHILRSKRRCQHEKQGVDLLCGRRGR